MKKMVSAITMTAMAASMFAMPAAAEEKTSSITYPLETDIESVSWYAQEGIVPHEKFKDASESPFHTGLAKHLGVNIDWSFPTTGSDANTFTNTLMADPFSLPNIMQCYVMDNAAQYIDDEIIWDLTDYIQEYAPDYYAFLQTNPAYDKAMKDDQGRYYTFGFFREDGGWNDSYEGPVVRKDWLDECGLEVPKTISEFENVFTLVSVYAKVGYALYDLYTFEGYAIKQWYENMGEKDGTPLSQIIGIYSYIHPNDAGYINSFFEEVKQGKAHHFRREVRVKSGDGWKWICANITRNPQSVDPNKPEMICINYDITELKDSQLKRERAEELDRLKSAFLANMSHEIRTPLNAIVGFSQLLAETDDPEERHEFVEIIDSNNRMLLQLISDILDLAKIESGTMDFKFADMSVKEVINEIVTSFRIKMPDNVALSAPKDSPECQIYSDRMRLTQVISNFLNNAIKYTSEGCITLAYEIIGDEIKFSVTDTGDGMSQEIQAHIFDRFYKGNTFKQGTGLGLSICETIVNRLGGRIGVNSELGKGSTFWFTHPYSFSPNAKSPASPNPGTI